ncbi:Short-chain dehydrogenase/reductase SDR [Penicillium digitatum]|uniref:Short-chain dehydrogenase/reductase SDR n=1 Tax=Penicillium digitatum TaxID=36651 RepID=A0A7T6XSJ3_PENDI|nr:Short-chain dehydrogenase/reductase SDR [Penicillium digitatum]
MARTKSPPTAGKSLSKPKEPKESDVKRQLLFLWACYKISDVQVDIPAVAKHFGIKNNAARMRFERLRKSLDKMEASTKNDDDHKSQTKEQTDDANTEDEGDAKSD